jgi:hypothetical protein
MFGRLIPSKIAVTRQNIKVLKMAKLHCICEQPSLAPMIGCSSCTNRYHALCVNVNPESQSTDMWYGPCCVPPPDPQEELTVILDASPDSFVSH